MIERTVTIIPNILPTLIDLTAEPTIEGTGATDSRNQTLAAGDQIPDVLNQSRDQQITADLSSETGFAIHTELDAAPASAPDYIVLDKHTFFSFAADLVTGDNQDMDTVGNWVARGSATITGGYDSGNPEHPTTLRIQAGDTTAEGANLDLSTAGATPFVDDAAYAILFDYKTISGSDSSHKLIVATVASATLLSFFGDDFPLSVGVWTTFLQVFHKGSLITGDLSDIDKVFVDVNISDGSAADEVLIDNFRIVPLPAISHHRHNADTLSGATQQPFLNVLGGDLGETLVRQSITAPGGIIVDSGDNALDLTIKGPKYVYDSTLERYVLRFNGANGYLAKSNDANLNFGANTDFSIEVIFKTNTVAASSALVDKGTFAAGGKRYMFYVDSTGKLAWILDDNATPKVGFSTDTVDDGEWHYGAVTFNRNGNAQLYIDGVSNGSAVDISDVVDVDDVAKPLAIGIASQDLVSIPFLGGIALGRISNRVLSQSEITERYNDGSPLDFIIPTADQGASQTALHTDFPANNDFLVSSPDGGWALRGTPTTCETDADSKLTVTVDADDEGLVFESGLFLNAGGKRFGVYFDLEISDNNGDERVRLFLGFGAADRLTDADFATHGWNTNGSHYFEFTSVSDDLFGTLIFRSEAYVDGFTFTVNNFRFVQIGAVAEWIIPDSAKEIRPTVDDVLVAKIGDTDTNKFLFSVIDTDGPAAGSDPKLGHYINGKSVSIAKIAKGSFSEGPSFPGIRSKRSFGGIDIASKDYGEKPSLGWTYTGLTDSERAELQAAYRLCVGDLHPLGLLIDEDGSTRYLSVKWTGYSEKRIGSRWQIPVKFVEHPR